MGQFVDSLFETLRQAGFRLDNERDLQFGQIAYNAATLIRIIRKDARDEQERLFRETGRNDPCPCGSGKKYKKCCLRARRAARADSTARDQRAPLDPALIPNPTDDDSAMCDLEVLGALFERDPELRKVRYSKIEATRFLEQELDEAAGTDQEAIDGVAHRYATEVEPEITDQLQELLTQAATRVSGTDELRALALGLFFALTCKVEGAGPNPLLCLLFRLSVLEHGGAQALVDRLVEELGGLEAARKKIVEGDAGTESLIRDLATSLDPDEVERLRESFEAQLDEAAEVIGQERFPVGLPLASLLPLWFRLHRLAQDGKPSTAMLNKAFAETLDDLVAEDLDLFGRDLDLWLAHDDGEDRALTDAVQMVRTLVAGDNLAPLWRGLAVWSVITGSYSPLEDGGDIPAGNNNSPFSPRFLKQYARLLKDRGYPALARRTRYLTGEQLELAFSTEDRSSAKHRRKEKRAR